MRSHSTTACLILIGALALGACEREPVVSEPAGGEPADAPTTAAPGGETAVQTPRLRAGLWRVTTETDGVGQTTRMCIDDAVQEQMSVMGGQMAGGACSPAQITPHPGGGYAIRSTCDMGPGGTMVSQGVVSGDFQSAYRSETVVTTTGAAVAHMNRSVSQVSEASHDGPCPADMRPGDLEMAGGMRLNMLEMAEQAAAMGGR